MEGYLRVWTKPKAYTVYNIVSLIHVIYFGTHNQVRVFYNTDSVLQRKRSYSKVYKLTNLARR